MKNTYTSPQLTIHGNVEKITRAFGPSPAQDTWVAGQSNVDQGGHSTGSIDGIIVPD